MPPKAHSRPTIQSLQNYITISNAIQKHAWRPPVFERSHTYKYIPKVYSTQYNLYNRNRKHNYHTNHSNATKLYIQQPTHTQHNNTYTRPKRKSSSKGISCNCNCRFSISHQQMSSAFSMKLSSANTSSICIISIYHQHRSSAYIIIYHQHMSAA